MAFHAGKTRTRVEKPLSKMTYSRSPDGCCSQEGKKIAATSNRGDEDAVLSATTTFARNINPRIPTTLFEFVSELMGFETSHSARTAGEWQPIFRGSRFS